MNATNTLILSAGRGLITIDGEHTTIAALVGRWVKLANGDNISRSDAIVGCVKFDEQDSGQCCPTCGDTATILRDGQVACKTCCNNADLDAQIESDDDLNPESLDDIGDRLRGRSIVDPSYLKKYVVVKQTVDTNRTVHCGDEIAEMLVGTSITSQLHIAAQLSGKARSWSHLNPGQQSMNARNVIRSSVKKLIAEGKDGLGALRATIDGSTNTANGNTQIDQD